MNHHIRAVYQSPHTDDPNKVLITGPISLEEICNEPKFQVDFLDGSYLMLDEMEPQYTTWELYSQKKDKTGKEICEGDILIDTENPRDVSPAVTFEEGCFYVGYIVLAGCKSDRLKVVGNIHL